MTAVTVFFYAPSQPVTANGTKHQSTNYTNRRFPEGQLHKFNTAWVALSFTAVLTRECPWRYWFTRPGASGLHPMEAFIGRVGPGAPGLPTCLRIDGHCVGNELPTLLTLLFDIAVCRFGFNS